MPVAVVTLYRKTARSSFNALVGALETDPSLGSVPVHFAQNAPAMIAAIEAERAAGRQALVCWSFYSPEVFEIASLFEAVLSGAGREGVLHLAAASTPPPSRPRRSRWALTSWPSGRARPPLSSW